MVNLPTAILGQTGLEVTRLGFGAMELRATDGDRAVTDNVSSSVLNAVLDAGINFIDTSPDYGVSEERIGKAISHRRDEFYVATKCGCPATPAALEAGGAGAGGAEGAGGGAGAFLAGRGATGKFFGGVKFGRCDFEC